MIYFFTINNNREDYKKMEQAISQVETFVRGRLEKDAYDGVFYENEEGGYEGAFEVFLDTLADDGTEIYPTTPGYDSLEDEFADTWYNVWHEIDREIQED